jgi:hypothetical protein
MFKRPNFFIKPIDAPSRCYRATLRPSLAAQFCTGFAPTHTATRIHCRSEDTCRCRPGNSDCVDCERTYHKRREACLSGRAFPRQIAVSLTEPTDASILFDSKRQDPPFRRQAPRLRRAATRLWGLTAQRGRATRRPCRESSPKMLAKKMSLRFRQCLTGRVLVFSGYVS